VLKAFLLLPALVLAVPASWWIYVHFGPELPDAGPERAVRYGLVLACLLWTTHLRLQGLGLIARWIVAAIMAVGCWVQPLGEDGASSWVRPAVAALIAYVLVCSLDLRPGAGDLQGVASVALVLPLGILAGTQVLAACALLSLLVLFDRRELAGGAGGLSLLLFTPLITCVPLAIWLKTLSGNKPFIEPISFNFPRDLDLGIVIPSSPQEAWPLLLLLSILLVRLLWGRSGRPDLCALLLPVAALLFQKVITSGNVGEAREWKAMSISGAASLLAISCADSLGLWLACAAALGVSVSVCFHEQVSNGYHLLLIRFFPT
jgi:hypothetical protein